MKRRIRNQTLAVILFVSFYSLMAHPEHKELECEIEIPPASIPVVIVDASTLLKQASLSDFLTEILTDHDTFLRKVGDFYRRLRYAQLADQCYTSALRDGIGLHLDTFSPDKLLSLLNEVSATHRSTWSFIFLSTFKAIDFHDRSFFKSLEELSIEGLGYHLIFVKVVNTYDLEDETLNSHILRIEHAQFVCPTSYTFITDMLLPKMMLSK